MVSPPPQVLSGAGAAATSTTNPGTTSVPGTQGAPGTQRGAAGSSAPAAALDRADIRPLDLAGALQILVAEVQSSLLEALHDAPSAFAVNAPTESLNGPVAAARIIVDLVLRSMPEAFEPSSWAAALPRVDLATQAGVQRALDAVSLWQDVPPAVVAQTKASATLALSLIADEQPYPLWPPAEWMGFAPRLARFWRRRRALERRPIDPDYGMVADPETSVGWDDLNEPS